VKRAEDLEPTGERDYETCAVSPAEFQLIQLITRDIAESAGEFEYGLQLIE
jgi:hypothetical protein